MPRLKEALVERYLENWSFRKLFARTLIIRLEFMNRQNHLSEGRAIGVAKVR